MIPLKDSLRRRSFPWVNVTFLAVNFWVFYREICQPTAESLERMIYRWALTPASFLSHPGAEWPCLFSSLFLHGGWVHLLGNAIYLWVFGDNVEDRLGHFRYAIFYFVSGLAATAGQVFLDPTSSTPLLGASGAIAGVMGAYFVLYPKAKILAVVPIFVFLRITEIRAVFFLGFWFLLQLFQSWGAFVRSAGRPFLDGIAWGAHAGGFAAGLILVFVFRKPSPARRS